VCRLIWVRINVAEKAELRPTLISSRFRFMEHLTREATTKQMSSPKKQQQSVSGSSPSRKQRDAVEALIAKPPVIVTPALSQLRYLVLVDGLSVYDPQDGQCSYRSYVWSILLRVSPSRSSVYVQLVQLGPSAAYSKIRNDTFRTLTSDKQFHSKVGEDALIRLLNSCAWKQTSTPRKVSNSKAHDGYVQGMNVLAAPFLYVCRSEWQAFAMFDAFLTRNCPLYVQPTLGGVHTGLSVSYTVWVKIFKKHLIQLVDICLEIIDKEVYDHLNSKLLSAKIYAFACMYMM
jgi:cell cycle arrest protein BUB2